MPPLKLLATLLIFATSASLAQAAEIKVTTDRTIDTSSLETIVQQVVARSGAKTNDEKAIALFDWLHATIFHAPCPTEKKPLTIGPLKAINVYGWGLCGSEHTTLKALFETAGWPCRYVGWSDPGHSTIEVQYDGKWHYLDVFLKTYFWTKDRTHIASQDEIAADHSIVLGAVKEGRAARQHLACGDTEEALLSGIRSRKVIGDEKGWANVTWRDEGYTPALTLPPGASLRLDWKNTPDGFAVAGKGPQHSCGIKDFRDDAVLGPILEHYGPRNWSSGQMTYAPDFTRLADVAAVELVNAKPSGGKITAQGGRGAAIFKLPLPYAYVSGEADAMFENGAGSISVSVDSGKTWTAAPGSDISALIRQQYAVWLKAEFTGTLARFTANAVVEHNRSAQPGLLPGRNVIAVALGKVLPNQSAKVTYTFQEATVADPEKRRRWDGQGITYGEIRTVQKEVAGSSSTFEIQVAGNTPPKMLAITREIVGKP